MHCGHKTNTNGQIVALVIAAGIAAIILAGFVFAWLIGQSTDGNYGNFNQ